MHISGLHPSAGPIPLDHGSVVGLAPEDGRERAAAEFDVVVAEPADNEVLRAALDTGFLTLDAIAAAATR